MKITLSHIITASISMQCRDEQYAYGSIGMIQPNRTADFTVTLTKLLK